MPIIALKIPNKIPFIKKIFSGEERTVLLKKNIIGSVFLKSISILISFLVVPLTIDFVNPTRYGIWLTLSSLMVWFNFFDIGLTLGFRNRFAEAKAKGQYKLARIYVSTTYASLLILFGTMLLVVLPINNIVNWSSILNISEEYLQELRLVFGVMIFFFSCTVILQVFTTLVTADQRPALTSLIQVSGQALALLIIFILTRIGADGNLVWLAIAFSGSPVIVVLISSVFFFFTKYKIYRPHWKYIKFRYVKDILGLGGKFFIITTSMLFVFQLMNIIISRNLGPESVAEYNIAYKYFNVVYMFAFIAISPYWSAFTDAYTRKDFKWMKSQLKKLERAWLLCLPTLIIMYFSASLFYKIWIGNSVYISHIINLSVAIYVFILIISAINMQLINGIGKLRIQLIIYLLFAFISFPLMNYFIKLWGIPGLLMIPGSVFLIQAILGRIQLNKILTGTSSGIWDK